MERGKRRRARIVDVHFDCKKPPDQITDRLTDLVGLGSSFSCGGRRREGECSQSPGQGWPPSYACTTTCRGNRGIAYM